MVSEFHGFDLCLLVCHVEVEGVGGDMPLLPEAQKNRVPACFYDNSPWLKVRGGFISHCQIMGGGGLG